MRAPLIQNLSPMQERFLGLEHLARGVPDPVRIVFRERDELLRASHLPVRRLELLGAVGPGVQEPGDIVFGEGRALVGG
jgi:hypothetical protein